MSRARIAASAVLVVLLAAPAGATNGVTIDAIDTSDAPAASVIVTVRDGGGDALTADDFAVVADGVRLPAEVYALIRDPMEVVVAIDTSGSMAGAALDEAREAAVGFVADLPANAAVAVVSFGDAVTVHTAMGAPRSEAIGAIESLVSDGETALYDAVMTATELFTGSDARRVLVLLSDGGDTVSAATLGEAAAAATAAAAEVRPVALATSESDTAALETLATTGGVSTAADAAGLAAAYEAVARELTGRYRLVFALRAQGTVVLSVYVDTPGGVIADSRVLDIATGAVIGSAEPKPAPQGFGVALPPPPTAIAQPAGFAASWALPAGIALVFVGLLLGLWLTTRGAAEEDAGTFVPDHDPEQEDRRWLGALAARARGLGDSIARRGRAGAVDQALDRAGVALRPGEFVVVAATTVVVGVTVGLVVAGTIGAILLGAAAAAAPRTVLRVLTDRRRRAFSDQLEGTLQTISGSLRAGYGLVQAINTVAAESPSPTSDEFDRVVVENRLGRSIEHSMAAMARRLENEDLGWVVEAIEIQHEVGGNLAEVLDTVTGTIRDRNQIRRQVKALSAEGRISAFILLALPFVIAAFIGMISPDYLSELTESTPGRIMLVVAAVLMVAGGAWIRKIIKVEF